MQATLVEPTRAGQRLPAVTGAKDNNGIPDLGEHQEVGLVFCNKYMPGLECQAAETLHIEGDVGAHYPSHETAVGVKQAKTHAGGFFLKPITGCKMGNSIFGCIYGGLWKRKVQ